MPSAGVQPLVHGFISSNRIADFVQSYKLKVVQKLVPGLRKEGYTESTQAYVFPTGQRIFLTPISLHRSSSQESLGQPRPQAPRASTPPYADHNPFGAHQRHFPSANPLSIGR